MRGQSRGCRRASESGSTIVEFILVLPILLGLAFAVWEVGRILDAQLVVTNAAREGARYAAVSEFVDVGDVTQRVMLYVQDGYGARLGQFDADGVCTGGDLCVRQSDIDVLFVNDATNVEAPGPGPGLRVHVRVPVTVRAFQTFVPGWTDPMTLEGRANMLLP